MKVVIDANVFVSAAICGGKPEAVVCRVLEGLDTLFITGGIIAEIEKTLKKPKFKKPKYNVTQDQIDELLADIDSFGQRVAVPSGCKSAGACRDPKDDMYLECALAAQADYVVTGDNDLLVMAEYGGVRMVSPSAYLDLCGPDTR